jgi:hypothetical protein
MYWQRPGPSRFVYPVVPTGRVGATNDERGLCVMFGSDRDGLPEGWHLVRIDKSIYYGKFVKVALNVLKARPTEERGEPNLLTPVLRTLFGGEVPPRAKVRFVKEVGAAVWELMVV